MKIGKLYNSKIHKREITQKANVDGLKVSNPKTPKFHMQPKFIKMIILVDQ